MATTKDRMRSAPEDLVLPDDFVLPDHVVAAEEPAPSPRAEAQRAQAPPRTVPARAVPPRPVRPWVAEDPSRLPIPWSVGAMLSWVFLLGLGIGVEPPPTNPEPDVSWMWVVDTFGFVWAGMLVATLVGLMTRQRWSLPLSLGTAAGLVAFTFACPATGHHSTTAGWWYIQIACGLALVAMSVAGLMRHR